MRTHRILKLAIFLIVVAACFALDAGLGMFGTAGFITLAMAGAAGEPEETEKKEKDEMLKSISDGIKEGLTPILEQLKKVSAEVKANPVSSDLKSEMLKTNPEYRFSAFLIALKKGDKETLAKIEAEEKAVTTANNETTTTAGGHLVPQITEARIRELIPTYGQALKYCEVMPMTSGNIINIPRLTAGVSGNWVDEQAAITPENITLGIDTLTPKKWAGLVPLSNELLEDANPAIGAFLIKNMAIGAGVALDTKVFQNGNTTFTGLFYASNSYGATITLASTNPTSLTYTNLVQATLGVDMNYNPSPGWYMSPSVLAIVLTLSDLQSRPIFDYNTRTLLGYPVNIIMKAPTSADVASKPIIIFGDLRNSIVGDVLGTRVSIASEGSVTIGGSYVSLLENDLSAVRAIKRFAFAPGLLEAYTVIKTKSS